MNQSMSARLLDAVNATGDGPTFSFELGAIETSVQLEVTGAPTRVEVVISGLLDGQTFGQMAVIDTDSGFVSGQILNLFPSGWRKIKANLATLTGGTNPTVSLYMTARR